MQVVVTGASGFLGRHVVRALIKDGVTVIASDLEPCPMDHPHMTALRCDLHDTTLQDAVRSSDAVIHLAATLGGAAEADPDAAFRTNVTTSLALMAACGPQTRFVFASSLAVLGNAVQDRAPVMTYGAHKAMVEIALETATRRGDLDGIALRPGGIVARRDTNPALKSAFLSRLFWAFAEGADLTLPVSGDAQSWMASVKTVAAQFTHALTADLGPVRSMTLPMTKVCFGDLLTALRVAHPESRANINFAPDLDIMALFGQAHPLSFDDALALGFRPDTDLAALVAAATQNGDQP